MTSEKIYVQYGCGLSAPEQWMNFDVSPSLVLQKIPLVGKFLQRQMKVQFPPNVLYGNIVKGLPVKDNSCDGLYCSHVLEHLALNDFRTAIRNSHKMLKHGGIFRCVVPDLETAAETYLNELHKGNKTASLIFLGKHTRLGYFKRPASLREFTIEFYGNSRHLWMWDYQSLKQELEQCGFADIRRAYFNDSADVYFKYVEQPNRFLNAVAIECKK